LKTHSVAGEVMATKAIWALRLTRHALDCSPWAQAHWQGPDLHFLPFFILLTAVWCKGLQRHKTLKQTKTLEIN
jgi:hypothetical protein